VTGTYEPLWNWIVERETIRLRKAANEPFPWSDDAILNQYRFCNVRREDDRGTIWIRKNIREPFADHPALWLMLCIARQINWPDTLAELIANNAWPLDNTFDPKSITAVLNTRKARGDKVYTGAYMISAPSVKGANKQSYIAETVIGDLWKRRTTYPIINGVTLRGMHKWITESNGWGPFMAYQAVVDMRFTSILENAVDVDSWAAAGPGTIRGLNRLHEREVDFALSQSQALVEMKVIYPLVKAETNVELDFSDVPNILCETDKYLRVLNGEGKPRAKYVVGRGA
jgi:hypothetical protein